VGELRGAVRVVGGVEAELDEAQGRTPSPAPTARGGGGGSTLLWLRLGLRRRVVERELHADAAVQVEVHVARRETSGGASEEEGAGAGGTRCCLLLLRRAPSPSGSIRPRRVRICADPTGPAAPGDPALCSPCVCACACCGVCAGTC